MKTKTISRCRFVWMAIVVVCLSNSARAGFIEICKDSLPFGGLSGSSSFTVGGLSGTLVVPVGACTLPFELTDGLADITELPQLHAKLVGVSTFPDDRLLTFDLLAGTASVLIVPGDISNETVVTFTNTPIPEPGTVGLLGLALLVGVLRGNRAKRPLGPLSGEAASSGAGRVSLTNDLAHK
jgi:hypothetical protein